MTRPDSPAHHVRLEDDIAIEADELDLALAQDRIDSLKLSAELQHWYMAGLHQMQEAAAWAEAERDTARAQIAELQAAFTADIAELAAANAELRQQLGDAETARDLAQADLRNALADIGLHLESAKVAA